MAVATTRTKCKFCRHYESQHKGAGTACNVLGCDCRRFRPARRVRPTSEPKRVSQIDRAARTKIDGITKRLDKLTSALERAGSAPVLTAAIDDLKRRVSNVELGARSVHERSALAAYRNALERIRQSPCVCAMIAPVGSEQHADSPTMPLSGPRGPIDHLASCHVAVAAKALGA